MIGPRLRGHPIVIVDGTWVYKDTGNPTATIYKDRACGHCGRTETKEGHDACLNTLPGVMNACCGHGDEEASYIQFLDGHSIHGPSATVIINELRKKRNTDENI